MRSMRQIQVKGEQIKLQMASMIDVVFLLLSFFVITYKIPSLEGDFSIRMPMQSKALQITSMDELTPVTVRLSADSKGQLNGIWFGSQSLGTDTNKLRMAVFQYIQQDDSVDFQTAFQGNTIPKFRNDCEVELDFDNQLRYKYIMQAITAVTGYLNGDNQMIKLVEKIKFAPIKEKGE